MHANENCQNEKSKKKVLFSRSFLLLWNQKFQKRKVPALIVTLSANYVFRCNCVSTQRKGRKNEELNHMQREAKNHFYLDLRWMKRFPKTEKRSAQQCATYKQLTPHKQNAAKSGVKANKFQRKFKWMSKVSQVKWENEERKRANENEENRRATKRKHLKNNAQNLHSIVSTTLKFKKRKSSANDILEIVSKQRNNQKPSDEEENITIK